MTPPTWRPEATMKFNHYLPEWILSPIKEVIKKGKQKNQKTIFTQKLV